MNKSLANKVLIVTGGSGGIGSAIVNELTKFEPIVVSTYNNNFPNNMHSTKVHFKQANLINSEEWESLLSFTLNKFGKVDVIINSIGFLEPSDSLILSDNQIRKMIDINLTSILIGVHKTLEIMKRQNFGHIINIGSIGGIVPMPYSAVYSATKFALRGFTISMVEELKNININISLISVDSVITRLLDKESTSIRPSISFYHKPINPELVARKTIEIIKRPKIEITIPAKNRISAILLGSFPNLFKFLYPLIENHSTKNLYRYKKSGRILN